MAVPDPHDRRLRGEISAAVRMGRPELEAELRRELCMRNIERAIGKYLNGTPLTPMEQRRLRLVLEEHGQPVAV
jgi:type II secretory pathway predicted ATPase ExeA